MNRILLALAFAAALTGSALAQSPVQQASAHLDAAVAVVVGTNFDTPNAQSVATITPPAGQFVYITRLEIEAVQNATGTGAANVNFTSSGLGTDATASPQRGVSSNTTAYGTLYRDVNFGTPFKSQTAGATVSITSPTALAHTGFGVKIYYYFSP